MLRTLRTFLTIAALAFLAACPPSAARIQAARTSHYQGPAPDLVALAEAAAIDQQYQIADEQRADGAFITVGKWYGAEGDVRTEGAGGTAVEDGAILLELVVRFVGSTDDATVEILPVMQRYASGRSNLDKIPPGDVRQPPWVQGKVDALYVAIHDALAGHTVAP